MYKFWTRISDPKDLIKIGEMLRANTTLKVRNHYFDNPDKTEISFTTSRKGLEWTRDNGEFYTDDYFKEVDNATFYAMAKKYYPKDIKIFAEITPEELENIYPSLKETDQTIFDKDCPAFKETAYLCYKPTDQIKIGWDRKESYNWFIEEGFKPVSLNELVETITGKPMKESNPKPRVGYPYPNVNLLGTWDYKGEGWQIDWNSEYNYYEARAKHRDYYMSNWQDEPGWIPIEVGEFTSEARKHFSRDKAYKHQKRTPWDPEL